MTDAKNPAQRFAGASAPAVAVLGASAKPERYSHRALLMLKEKGYRVIPVHPALKEIAGLPVYASLGAVGTALDTITVYLSPERSGALCRDFLRANPRRVIFNPGTEHPEMEDDLRRAGIAVVHACTLVMLTTGTFE